MSVECRYCGNKCHDYSCPKHPSHQARCQGCDLEYGYGYPYEPTISFRVLLGRVLCNDCTEKESMVKTKETNLGIEIHLNAFDIQEGILARVFSKTGTILDRERVIFELKPDLGVIIRLKDK